MISSLASSNGIILSDQYGGIIGTWSTSNADGIHPNDTGYATVARTWYNSIAGLISSSGDVSEGGGGGGGGGGSSLCCVAAAAFGSPMEKHVMLLRQFRDRFLLTNSPGRQFVSAYYRYSPPLAAYIARHESLKTITRVMLYPLVGISFFLVELTPPIQLLFILVLLGLLTTTALVVNRRKKA